VGAQAVAVPTDVSIRKDVEKLAEEAVSRFGRVDVWVNNAGAGAQGRFEDIPLEIHEQVIGTTLLGALYGSWCAMRQFRRQGAGTLINIASIAGKLPHAYYSSYVAAKHGVVGLSRFSARSSTKTTSRRSTCAPSCPARTTLRSSSTRRTTPATR
jgi:NAD(P)-dependent dehydrogenase (short-subunit alcohol dehydrogenase family)